MSRDSSRAGRWAEQIVCRRFGMRPAASKEAWDGVMPNGHFAEVKLIGTSRIFFGTYQKSVDHLRAHASQYEVFFVWPDEQVMRLLGEVFARLVDAHGRVQFQVSVPRAEQDQLLTTYPLE